MYCKKCGQQLNDHAKFCSRCGTLVIQPTPVTQQVLPPVKPKKKSFFIPLLIALFLVSIAGGFVFQHFSSNKQEPTPAKEKETNIAVKEETREAKETAKPEETSAPQTLEVNTKHYTDDEIKDLLYANTAYFYRNYIESLNISDISKIEHIAGDLEKEIKEKLKDYHQEVELHIEKIWMDEDSIRITKENDKYIIQFDYGADLSYERNGFKESHPKFHGTMEIYPENNDWVITRSETGRNLNTGNHRLIDITHY